MRLQSELLRGQPRDAPEPGRERLIMRNEYISTHAIRVKIIVSRRSVVAVLSSSFLPPPPLYSRRCVHWTCAFADGQEVRAVFLIATKQ